MSRYIPDLVVRMIGECEAQEMIEFMAFLSMLVHKLKVGRRVVLSCCCPFDTAC
jgi:hypothetical protein